MTRPLPVDASLEWALRHQEGWGREATAAHPDCRCGKPYWPTCWQCEARPGKPCKALGYEADAHFGAFDSRIFDVATRFPHHPARRQTTATRKQCPMHRPARRTT